MENHGQTFYNKLIYTYPHNMWLREQLNEQCNKQRFSIESNLWCFRFLHFLFLLLGFFFLLILLLFRLADLCWAVCWFVLLFLHLFHYWRWVGSSGNSCNLLRSHSSRNCWEQIIYFKQSVITVSSRLLQLKVNGQQVTEDIISTLCDPIP